MKHLQSHNEWVVAVFDRSTAVPRVGELIAKLGRALLVGCNPGEAYVSARYDAWTQWCPSDLEGRRTFGRTDDGVVYSQYPVSRADDIVFRILADESGALRSGVVEHVSGSGRKAQEYYSVVWLSNVQNAPDLRRVVVKVRASAFVSSEAARAWVESAVAAASAHAFDYGFVHIIDDEDNEAGPAFYWGFGIADDVAGLEQDVYHSEGAARSKFVRPLRWGNFLGSELAARAEYLKGFRLDLESCVEEHRALATAYKASPQSDLMPSPPSPFMIHTNEGGVFVGFSESPLTWTARDPDINETQRGIKTFGMCTDLAVKLHRTLRERGLML